jgi:hypothetical protein
MLKRDVLFFGIYKWVCSSFLNFILQFFKKICEKHKNLWKKAEQNRKFTVLNKEYGGFVICQTAI